MKLVPSYVYVVDFHCTYVYSFVQVLLLLVLKRLVKVQLPGCCPEQTVLGMNPHCYNVLLHNTREEGV